MTCSVVVKSSSYTAIDRSMNRWAPTVSHVDVELQVHSRENSPEFQLDGGADIQRRQ